MSIPGDDPETWTHREFSTWLAIGQTVRDAIEYLIESRSPMRMAVEGLRALIEVELEVARPILRPSKHEVLRRYLLEGEGARLNGMTLYQAERYLASPFEGGTC